MIITRKNLIALLKKLDDDGLTVNAPVMLQNSLVFSEIASTDEIEWNYINPHLSIKGSFLPRCEPLLEYSLTNDALETKQIIDDHIRDTILFGVRPCDAASLGIMDKVFTWDYIDEYWTKRREQTGIIAVSCIECDEACFCRAMNLDPGSTSGSDILLTPIDKETYLVEVNSEKGKKILDTNKDFFAEGEADKSKLLAAVREKLGEPFELETIQPWLEENFYHDFWIRETLYCIGCGICTFVCPTCHCFDIVDEGTPFKGARMKFWDACQFRTYTLHASGHNPRSRQDERHRQRIQHKFNYYKTKFNETLCVGCGRCIRNCPVDLSILRLLTMIDRMSKESQTKR